MSCRSVRRALSEYRDGELSAERGGRVASHLRGCWACSRHYASLCRSLNLLSEVPRVEFAEGITAEVLHRLEVESRGPGLALLFRSGTRPLMVQSLVQAAVLVVGVLYGAVAFDQPIASDERAPVDVLPQIQERGPSGPVLARMREGTFFLETDVAQDGRVWRVQLLAGDEVAAAPLLAALRQDRFQPLRFRGRSVAASVYRLVSHLDVTS